MINACVKNLKQRKYNTFVERKVALLRIKINEFHALVVHSVVMLMTRAYCPAAVAAAAHASYVNLATNSVADANCTVDSILDDVVEFVVVLRIAVAERPLLGLHQLASDSVDSVRL